VGLDLSDIRDLTTYFRKMLQERTKVDERRAKA